MGRLRDRTNKVTSKKDIFGTYLVTFLFVGRVSTTCWLIPLVQQKGFMRRASKWPVWKNSCPYSNNHFPLPSAQELKFQSWSEHYRVVKCPRNIWYWIQGRGDLLSIQKEYFSLFLSIKKGFREFVMKRACNNIKSLLSIIH